MLVRLSAAIAAFYMLSGPGVAQAAGDHPHRLRRHFGRFRFVGDAHDRR